jgi:hypothetical protein
LMLSYCLSLSDVHRDDQVNLLFDVELDKTICILGLIKVVVTSRE